MSASYQPSRRTANRHDLPECGAQPKNQGADQALAMSTERRAEKLHQPYTSTDNTISRDAQPLLGITVVSHWFRLTVEIRSAILI